MALAGGLFVAGCNHGKDRQAEMNQVELAAAAKQTDAARAEAAENLRAYNANLLALQDCNTRMGEIRALGR